MNKAEFWQTLVFRFLQKAAGKKTWHKVSTSPPLTTKNILVPKEKRTNKDDIKALVSGDSDAEKCTYNQ